MNVILNREEDMSSSIPKIMTNLQLLDDVLTSATAEQDAINEQIAQENMTTADAAKFLRETSELVDSTQETVAQLRPKFMQAAAVIYEEEVKRELKEEKMQEARKIGFTPESITSFLPTQTAHYATEKITEKIEITVSHRPESLQSSRGDALQTTIKNGSLIERFPVGDDVNELLQYELFCKPDHTLKPTPRDSLECIRDSTTPLIRHSLSQSVLEDVTSSENLANEMSLLE